MEPMKYNDPIFRDADKAREFLEAQRWPDGPVCPHCGVFGDDVTKVEGKAHRPGLYQCNGCRGQFTVTVGSVFERSKIPLHKWMYATYLLCSSKKGMSAHQLARTLGVTYKTAWFMFHRIREAMKDTAPSPLGGEGKSVQADETYYGNSSKRAKGYRKGLSHKQQIVALVEPSGYARVLHVNKLTANEITRILRKNVHRKSELHTDESKLYTTVGREFAKHKTVEHGPNRGHGTYVGPDGETTNAAENFFGTFKRGMVGCYYHCEAQHLQRYLTEFEFRHNHRSGIGIGDGERTKAALKGAAGKRLMYRRPRAEAHV